MISLTVLYPQTADSHFDMAYYVDTHTPLVRERLTPAGLTGITLAAGVAGASPAPDSPPVFAMICQLHFATPDELQAALAAHAPELMGDIPNFTNVEPIMQISRAV